MKEREKKSVKCINEQYETINRLFIEAKDEIALMSPERVRNILPVVDHFSTN